MHTKANRKIILDAKEDEADKAVILSMLPIRLTMLLKIIYLLLMPFRIEPLWGGLQMRDTLIVKADAAS